MSGIVLLRQEIEGKVREAATVAGYSERNFSRYLNGKTVQGLPLGCAKNLYDAGFISEETYKAIKQERIDEITHYKKGEPRFPGALKKLLMRL